MVVNKRLWMEYIYFLSEPQNLAVPNKSNGADTNKIVKVPWMIPIISSKLRKAFNKEKNSNLRQAQI